MFIKFSFVVFSFNKEESALARIWYWNTAAVCEIWSRKIHICLCVCVWGGGGMERVMLHFVCIGSIIEYYRTSIHFSGVIARWRTTNPISTTEKMRRRRMLKKIIVKVLFSFKALDVLVGVIPMADSFLAFCLLDFMYLINLALLWYNWTLNLLLKLELIEKVGKIKFRMNFSVSDFDDLKICRCDLCTFSAESAFLMYDPDKLVHTFSCFRRT